MAETWVTFTVGGLHLALPVQRVEEVLRRHQVTRIPLAPHGVAGLMNLRGQLVLAIDLRARIGVFPRDPDAQPMHVVVSVGGSTYGLLVDEIGDVLDLEVDVHDAVPDRIRGDLRHLLTGVLRLPDHLLLALDVERVIREIAPHLDTSADGQGAERLFV
ncbi:MAG: purine-binding chemotaxis protein CheW [Myxococcales bacterium]|nr:purine-binding chemotaxis protein CheW [Myxococcales bacterium]